MPFSRREVDLPADEGGVLGAGEIGAEASEGALGVEDPHRFGLALERGRLQLLVVEGLGGGLVGPESHSYPHLGSHRLDPRGGVDRITGDEPFP